MDADEFTETFRQYLPKVSKYLAYRVHRNDVEDLAAEIFLIAWNKRASCPKDAELPWLYRISGFVLANHRRKSIRNQSFQLFDTDLTAPAAEDVFLADHVLQTAWIRLEKKDQSILALAALEGLKPAEIAVVLGVSTNAVSIRLHRARKNLEVILKELEG
jgi:RNA polymerase sigma-70 factor (ECF subfamily)